MGKETQSLPFESIKALPVEDEKRHCTDVCCLVIGLLFTIGLVVAAAVLFDKSTFYKVNFPADADGKLCGYDLPDYQYLYFSNAPLINSRVCVSKCPSKGDISLSCHPNSLVPTCGFSPLNRYYDSAAEKTRMGFFCYPVDPIARDLLKTNAHLVDQQDFFDSLDSIKSSLLVAAILSLVYLILVQIVPRIMNYVVIPLGAIALLVTAIFLFTFKTEDTAVKDISAIVLLALVGLIIVSILKNPRSLKMHAIFLDHSSRMLAWRPWVIIYIILYIVMLVAFVGVILFQFAGFWTAGRTIFVEYEYVYYKLNGLTVSPLVTAVLAIQFIWGAGFLKESFNFCVSGNSALWYFAESAPEKIKNTFHPFKVQVANHMGSVIACSFVTAFFTLFDFVFDLVKPFDRNSLYGKCFYGCCWCCLKIWDLVRSDAMGYVYLTALPFCNAARYCEYLCEKTIITDYSQSCSRTYRLCAHGFVAGTSALYCIFATDNKSIWALGLVLLGAIAISTFFISLHADSAEAIQILYLVDQQFINRDEGQKVHKPDSLAHATYRPEIATEVAGEYNQAS